MKTILRSLLAIFFIVLVCNWYGCQKKDSPAPPIPPVDPLVEKVTASVQGRVIDENKKPVKAAIVKAGTNQTTTNINGEFHFDNIQIAKNAGFVLVEKEGYLKGSRTVLTTESTVNIVEIQLIPKVNRGDFASSAGGNITIADGSTVSFPSNAIINETTKVAYIGTVNVFGAYLDPADPQLSSIMPGNLTGITTGNELKALQTFGMLAVELEGAAGEKLNLASGKIATINLPIPASMLATAPANIPLWYFNETKGVWVEEGTATKNGNNYVGTVAHFSFWNWDVPVNLITLTLTLKDNNEEPLQGYKVELINKENKSSAYGYTNNYGLVNGPVPANAVLQMKVYNYCGDIVHVQDLGPYATSTNAGIITVSLASMPTVTISGKLLNCSNNPVTDGFAEIKMGGAYFRGALDLNGNYSITISKCTPGVTNAVVIGVDLANNQTGGDSISIAVTTGNIVAPTVRACGTNIPELIKYTIDGVNIRFLEPEDSVTAYRNTNTNIFAMVRDRNPIVNQSTSFYIAGLAKGTFNVTGLDIKRGDKRYVQNGALSTTVTTYGPIGGYIEGSFSGTVKDNATNAILPMQCTYKVKRTN